MEESKSLRDVFLTIFDRRFAFSFILMLIIWLSPSPADEYSALHLLPECVVIFVLGENVKKVINSLILCVIPALLLVIVCIIPYMLLYSLTLSIVIGLIFAIFFVGGYVLGKRT